jgi:hypothetical protein
MPSKTNISSLFKLQTASSLFPDRFPESYSLPCILTNQPTPIYSLPVCLCTRTAACIMTSLVSMCDGCS